VILLFALITAARSLDVDNTFSFVWIVAQGLTIGAWVALWYPLEHFVYGLWEQREGAMACTILAAATVEISRQTDGRPPSTSRSR
jgi:hypothetical protein